MSLPWFTGVKIHLFHWNSRTRIVSAAAIGEYGINISVERPQFGLAQAWDLISIDVPLLCCSGYPALTTLPCVLLWCSQLGSSSWARAVAFSHSCKRAAVPNPTYESMWECPSVNYLSMLIDALEMPHASQWLCFWSTEPGADSSAICQTAGPLYI